MPLQIVHVNPKLLHRHLTDKILTLFHLPFPYPLSDHISLWRLSLFLEWNWGTFFYKQTGRLDLNLNKTLLENAAVCSLRKTSRWLICLMNAGHFCRNLLFRLNFSAGTSRHSWHVSLQIFIYFFSFTFHSSLSRKDMTFPKQVLI